MKNSIKVVLLICVVMFSTGCTCKVKTITKIEQSFDKNNINNITKIEYSSSSSSMAPEHQRTRIIVVTKELVEERLYSHYGDVLVSVGNVKINQVDFNNLKNLIVDNNISACTQKKVSCNGEEYPQQIATGCDSDSLSFYNKDKEIFSQYKACERGKLCGNYYKVIHGINDLSASIEMKKVDNKLIQLESVQENYKLQKITLFFDSDKYDLDKKSIEKLESFIDSLKNREHMTIKIMGNTDRFGSQEYNYYKGLKRAKFAEKFFISKGFKKENIISLSFGESNPMCVEITKECHAKNRRVDILEMY